MDGLKIIAYFDGSDRIDVVILRRGNRGMPQEVLNRHRWNLIRD